MQENRRKRRKVGVSWLRNRELGFTSACMPDLQVVVPHLAKPIRLGNGQQGVGDGQFSKPFGAAWVPGYPNWLATTEINGDRVKITDVSTGDTICKFGEKGRGHGQLSAPWGLTITADSRFVIVADMGNARVQVLELVIGGDRSAVRLKFIRAIGCARAEWLDPVLHRANALRGGMAELKASPGYKDWVRGLRAGRPKRSLKTLAQLCQPVDVALQTTCSKGVAHQTILVADSFLHRVLHFELDGTFIGKFAGSKKGKEGSGRGVQRPASPHSAPVRGSSRC
jgi:hypothetical protein